MATHRVRLSKSPSSKESLAVPVVLSGQHGSAQGLEAEETYAEEYALRLRAALGGPPTPGALSAPRPP